MVTLYHFSTQCGSWEVRSYAARYELGDAEAILPQRLSMCITARRGFSRVTLPHNYEVPREAANKICVTIVDIKMFYGLARIE